MGKLKIHSLLCRGQVFFVGKRPDMDPADQEIVDPYINGHLDAIDVSVSVPTGAFREGLVLMQVLEPARPGKRMKNNGQTIEERYLEVVALRYDPKEPAGFREKAWDLRRIDPPQPGELVKYMVY